MSLSLSVAAAVLALAVVSAVRAHAEPARVSPGDGAVLTSAPPAVDIEMSQELARQVGANDIDVLDASGREVTTVAATIDNANRKRLAVPLPANLAPGRYTVRWKSFSAEDGDTAEGELSFTFDPSGTANPGKQNLREDIAAPPAAASRSPVSAPGAPGVDGEPDGVTWILVAAVGVGMFVLGSGATFLLVQRRP